MICRKCSAELPDNAIRCTNCGIKVNMFCPECKTLNPFGEKYCKNCGFELIKTCPACHSSNIYSAIVCRKCQTPLNTQTASPNIEIVTPISYSAESKPEEQLVSQISSPIQQEETPEDSVTYFTHEEEETTADEPEEEEKEDEEEEEVSESIPEETFEEYPQDETVEETIEYIEYEQEESEPVIDEEPQEEEIEDQDIEQEVTTNTFDIQQNSVNKIVKTIKTSLEKHIIAVTGDEGCGKSAVLKQVSNTLNEEGYICLYGNSTPLSQITSFGFFQDAFLRMMGFPPYINSSEAFIKDFKKSGYVNSFNFLDNDELTLFLNMFYPVLKDNYENIIDNKEIMFSILEKVIKSFLVSSNVIIAIDNFELLDGASYDFIMYLINKNSFNTRLKLLVAYQENKSIESYFELNNIDDKLFETFYLEKLTKEELINTVNNTLSFDIQDVLPAEIIDEIIERTNGNALRMEQELAYLFDVNFISVENNEIFLDEENKPQDNPQSLEELIKLRINSLTPEAKNVLFMAAIMGYRFATNVLSICSTIPDKKAAKIIEFLKQELYINSVDNYTCEFKSLSIWMLIYQEAKSDLLYKENCQRLYQTLKPLILSSSLQKLISCKDALSKKEEFTIWQQTTEIASKLGDTNLFVISQKQSLKILDEEEIEDSEKIRLNIYEQIGKILTEKSPTECVTYLANVLDYEIKNKNINKIIDVSGYFINSCYLSGNYFGAAEAVDAIIKNLQENNSVSDIELALIKTRKLKALINIGNSEQIINLTKEEILPSINKELETSDLGYKNLSLDAWLITNIALAKALAMQGNNEVFDVINSVKEFISRNNYKTDYFTTQIELTEAFANSSRGNTNESNRILNEIKDRYLTELMESNLLAEWNLVSIINRIFNKETKDLKPDLFEIATFTNNINEHFIKNISKLILGYVLLQEKNIKKALTIFNEEITYFAKEKVAIGALLSWALIVRLSIDTHEIEKALNTATKALEIAQSPKINNYFFMIYFQMLLAEIYMAKNDLIAAKMYLEKAIMLAKQYDLKLQLVDLYTAYGKYMQEQMAQDKAYSKENLKVTLDAYNKGVTIAKELNIKHMIDNASRERSAFKTFCQLKSIEL